MQALSKATIECTRVTIQTAQRAGEVIFHLIEIKNFEIIGPRKVKHVLNRICVNVAQRWGESRCPNPDHN